MEGFMRAFTGEWDRIVLRPPYKFLEAQDDRIPVEQHKFQGVDQSRQRPPVFGVRWIRMASADDGAHYLKYADPLIPLPEEIRTDAVLLCCSAFLRGMQFAVWLFDQAAKCLLPGGVDTAVPQWVQHNRTRFYLEVHAGKTVRLLVFSPLRAAGTGSENARVILLRDTTFMVVEKRGVYCRPRGQHRDMQYVRSLGQGDNMWPTVRRRNCKTTKFDALPEQIRARALETARSLLI